MSGVREPQTAVRRVPDGVGAAPAVVVLRALALGDLLTAVPALRAIRRAFPRHLRYLTAPVWLHPLVAHADLADVCLGAAPTGDGSIWRTRDPRERIALERAQIGGLVGAPCKPDVAINLRGVRAELHYALLRLGPRRFIGFANVEVPRSVDGPAWDPDEHEVMRWCRLLSTSGFACDPSELDITSPETELSQRLAGCVVIHPGAGSPARQWPEDRWAELARELRQAGRRVVLTGGRDETAACGRVAGMAGIQPEDNLVGSLRVLDLLAVIGSARLVISVDTGVAHMAFASRTRSITLYGPMPPSRWGPPRNGRHQVIWRGAVGEPYADRPDPTILAISTSDVLAAARRELELSL